jgi:hypothetical protein
MLILFYYQLCWEENGLWEEICLLRCNAVQSIEIELEDEGEMLL